MNLLVWIISGIIAGWLAGMMVQGSGFGLPGDFFVGLIGGLVGGFLASVIGVQPTSWLAQILVAALGGVVFVWILHVIHPGTIST